ncbi:helix-turn-helix domain-containing protein [Streptomyces chartreusis]
MRRTDFRDWPCSVARTAQLLGDHWTSLILREAFYGVRRFDCFQGSLGIARNTLAERLRHLVGMGLLAKRPYQNEPTRYEYVLTEKGREFFPVLMAMVVWGDRWLAEDQGPPVVFEHLPCGHDARPQMVCGCCRAPLEARDIRPHFGPGYPRDLAALPGAQERFAPPKSTLQSNSRGQEPTCRE